MNTRFVFECCTLTCKCSYWLQLQLLNMSVQSFGSWVYTNDASATERMQSCTLNIYLSQSWRKKKTIWTNGFIGFSHDLTKKCCGGSYMTACIRHISTIFHVLKGVDRPICNSVWISTAVGKFTTATTGMVQKFQSGFVKLAFFVLFCCYNVQFLWTETLLIYSRT